MAAHFDPLGGASRSKSSTATNKSTVKQSAKITEILDDDVDFNENTNDRTNNNNTNRNKFEWKHDERMCIYAPYIDKDKTIKEGRKLPRELCCERPMPFEIKEAIEKGMNLKCELEDKCYSRDFWQRGRIRVEYKDPINGEPINAEFPTRRSILIECARLVPMHWGRSDGSTMNILRSPEDIFDAYLLELAKQGGLPGTGKNASNKNKTSGGKDDKSSAKSGKKKGKKGRK